MRLGTFTLSAIVSAVLMLGIGYTVPESRPIATPPKVPYGQNISRALSEPASLNAQGLPLRDVVRQLSYHHNVPVVLDYDALRAEGKTGGEPVNLVVSGASLRGLLQLVVRQVGVSYAIREDSIVITTIEALETDESQLVGKVYLLRPPLLDSLSLTEDTLADLITCTIAPQCWAQVGGPGELRVMPGALAVIQTPDIHDEIQFLLSQLENWQESSDSTSPIYLSSWDYQYRHINETLKRTGDVQFREAPLDEVCRHLSNEYEIPIVIDHQCFDEIGHRVDMPVTLNLRGVRLRTALREMLDQVQVPYSLLDGVITITTDHGHAEVLRAYLVADLLGTDGRSAGCNLVQTVTSLVDPNAWDFVGGPSSAKLIGDQILLICAEDMIHEEVELLLGEMRDALGQTAPFADGSGRTPMTRKIEAALRQPTSLKFEETLLDQVAGWVRETYDINVKFNYVRLDSFSVSADTRVTCNIRGKSLEEALREALRPLGLGIMVSDDMLWIQTAWECDNHSIRRYYDARQLVGADFGLLDQRTLSELIRRAVDFLESRSNEPRFIAIHNGILIAFEPRDAQRRIGRVLIYLTDNRQKLKREIEASDLSRDDLLKRLLQEIRANVDMDANIQVLRDEADRLRDE